MILPTETKVILDEVFSFSYKNFMEFAGEMFAVYQTAEKQARAAGVSPSVEMFAKSLNEYCEKTLKPPRVRRKKNSQESNLQDVDGGSLGNTNVVTHEVHIPLKSLDDIDIS